MLLKELPSTGRVSVVVIYDIITTKASWFTLTVYPNVILAILRQVLYVLQESDALADNIFSFFFSFFFKAIVDVSDCLVITRIVPVIVVVFIVYSTP